MLMLPILLLFVVGILLFGYVGSAISNVTQGGIVSYDETVFQEYADRQYAAEFSSSSAYEDNLLIVFLTNEEADGYYVIAWLGDNVDSSINQMFGDETTTFGRVLLGSVNSEYYAYSLDSNLATAMETMAKHIDQLNLDSSFKTQKDHSNMVESHLTNYTDLSLTKETVDDSLRSFTEDTGIPAVIVVDTMENVFGKTLPLSDIMTILILIALAVVAIVLIVKTVKKNKKNDPKNENQNRYNQNPGGNYRSFH